MRLFIALIFAASLACADQIMGPGTRSRKAEQTRAAERDNLDSVRWYSNTIASVKWGNFQEVETNSNVAMRSEIEAVLAGATNYARFTNAWLSYELQRRKDERQQYGWLRDYILQVLKRIARLW